MNDPRAKLGLAGEQQAERFLKRRGLRTVARRYATPVGELDLVMRAGKTIVFVEVKTLRSRRYADPEDAVRADKQRKLARCAEWFLRRRGWTERPYRFDVVAVVLPDEGAAEIDHFVDAFFPTR